MLFYSQVSAPEYRILISNIAGEQRFASTVAKRLQTLGALTHGDRRAANFRELGQFRIDTKHGLSALNATMNAVMGFPNPVVKPPHDYEGEFFKGKFSMYSILKKCLFLIHFFFHLYRSYSCISQCWSDVEQREPTLFR